MFEALGPEFHMRIIPTENHKTEKNIPGHLAHLLWSNNPGPTINLSKIDGPENNPKLGNLITKVIMAPITWMSPNSLTMWSIFMRILNWICAPLF